MKKIAIVVDSTSGISKQEVDKIDGLTMIPLFFMFGEQTYLDGVDLTIEEFFDKCDELYEKEGVMPTTSQPSVGKCIEVFEELLKDYDHIIYYTISDKMSGTYQNGKLAAEDFEGKVDVVNTKTTSHAQLLPALCALEMVKEGKSVEEIIEQTTKIFEKSEIYFIVSDLKHLQRTGRIGAAAAAIGNALQLKPILTVKNGEVDTFEKVRNINKAYKKLASYVNNMNLTENDQIYFIEAAAQDRVKLLEDELSTQYKNLVKGCHTISPVIAVNTGPNIVGVIIFKDIV